MDGFRFRPQTTPSGMAKERAGLAINPLAFPTARQ